MADLQYTDENIFSLQFICLSGTSFGKLFSFFNHLLMDTAGVAISFAPFKIQQRMN